MVSWPCAAVRASRLARSGRSWPPTRGRSSSHATGWWPPTDWAATPAASAGTSWRPNVGCWKRRELCRRHCSELAARDGRHAQAAAFLPYSGGPLWLSPPGGPDARVVIQAVPRATYPTLAGHWLLPEPLDWIP